MRTAVITGASRGIGRALAEVFAAAGYRLVLNCKSRFAQLDVLAEGLTQQYGVSAVPVHAPITEETLAAAFKQLQEDEETHSASMGGQLGPEEGNMLILINNAGVSQLGLLQDVTDADWERMVEANLGGMFRASRAVIPYMLQQHCGRIINISSVWGDVGASCEVVYSMTKGGINAFTRALAKELAPSGISVNAVACGAVDTEMNAWLEEAERRQLEEEIPFGRMAAPKEVAAFVLQLAESPAYLSGQVIRFDGAWI